MWFCSFSFLTVRFLALNCVMFLSNWFFFFLCDWLNQFSEQTIYWTLENIENYFPFIFVCNFFYKFLIVPNNCGARIWAKSLSAHTSFKLKRFISTDRLTDNGINTELRWQCANYHCARLCSSTHTDTLCEGNSKENWK